MPQELSRQKHKSRLLETFYSVEDFETRDESYTTAFIVFDVGIHSVGLVRSIGVIS